MKQQFPEKVGVLGAGTMGSGIAQVAAASGHPTVLFDSNPDVIKKAGHSLEKNLEKLVEKGRMSSESALACLQRISFASALDDFSDCGLVIEAIIEDLGTKKKVLSQLDTIVLPDAVLASNTSSFSITSLASAVADPGRVMGIHFFNPAPLMPLVEVIPGMETNQGKITDVKTFITSWGKSVVIAKDTPGFIVNRVARPYYGEALRIFDEGWSGIRQNQEGFAIIDKTMRELGGFRMGPFELMDLIGNDINYKVTETVWSQSYFDPRYKPSLTQKKMVESGRLGKKSGRGYYNYTGSNQQQEIPPVGKTDKRILDRILAMLINEAADALYLGIATRDDIDLAMTKGVNYPKGLLAWCDEIGAKNVLGIIQSLYEEYREERYRPSVLLKRMGQEDTTFYESKKSGIHEQ